MPVTSNNPAAPGPFVGQAPGYTPTTASGDVYNTDLTAIAVAIEHLKQMVKAMMRDDWATPTTEGLAKGGIIGWNALTPMLQQRIQQLDQAGLSALLDRLDQVDDAVQVAQAASQAANDANTTMIGLLGQANTAVDAANAALASANTVKTSVEGTRDIVLGLVSSANAAATQASGFVTQANAVLTQVMSAANFLPKLPPVDYLRDTPLPASTYANGANNDGIGATITLNAAGVLTIDGDGVALGKRIFVGAEANAAYNGLYTLTTLGTASVSAVLTRATDGDQAAELGAMCKNVTSGAKYTGYVFRVDQAPANITIGTTGISVTISPASVAAEVAARQAAIAMLQALIGDGSLPVELVGRPYRATDYGQRRAFPTRAMSGGVVDPIDGDLIRIPAGTSAVFVGANYLPAVATGSTVLEDFELVSGTLSAVTRSWKNPAGGAISGQGEVAAEKVGAMYRSIGVAPASTVPANGTLVQTQVTITAAAGGADAYVRRPGRSIRKSLIKDNVPAPDAAAVESYRKGPLPAGVNLWIKELATVQQVSGTGAAPTIDASTGAVTVKADTAIYVRYNLVGIQPGEACVAMVRLASGTPPNQVYLTIADGQTNNVDTQLVPLGGGLWGAKFNAPNAQATIYVRFEFNNRTPTTNPVTYTPTDQVWTDFVFLRGSEFPAAVPGNGGPWPKGEICVEQVTRTVGGQSVRQIFVYWPSGNPGSNEYLKQEFFEFLSPATSGNGIGGGKFATGYGWTLGAQYEVLRVGPSTFVVIQQDSDVSETQFVATLAGSGQPTMGGYTHGRQHAGRPVAAAVTISIANPAVFTTVDGSGNPVAHGLAVGQQVSLSTLDTLPAPLVMGRTYKVQSVPSASTVQLALLFDDTNTPISTAGGSQSGVHNLRARADTLLLDGVEVPMTGNRFDRCQTMKYLANSQLLQDNTGTLLGNVVQELTFTATQVKNYNSYTPATAQKMRDIWWMWSAANRTNNAGSGTDYQWDTLRAAPDYSRVPIDQAFLGDYQFNNAYRVIYTGGKGLGISAEMDRAFWEEKVLAGTQAAGYTLGFRFPNRNLFTRRAGNNLKSYFSPVGYVNNDATVGQDLPANVPVEGTLTITFGLRN